MPTNTELLCIGKPVRWRGEPGARCTILEVGRHMVRIEFKRIVPEGTCGHCGGDGKWIDNHTREWGGWACPECRGSGYRPVHLESVSRWVKVDELLAVLEPELEAVS